MKTNFQLDDKAYSDLLRMLNTLHFNERVGDPKDIAFIMRRLADKDPFGLIQKGDFLLKKRRVVLKKDCLHRL